MEEPGFEKVGFLVQDESLRDADSDFVSWLREEGFRAGFFEECYGCSWVFVSITKKTFAYGMPGVRIVHPLGNHAVTIDEFRAIYEIFKKYEGLPPLVF